MALPATKAASTATPEDPPGLICINAAEPRSDLSGIAFLRITPKVISVLDYTKGFGHTQLVTL